MAVEGVEAVEAVEQVEGVHNMHYKVQRDTPCTLVNLVCRVLPQQRVASSD